MIDYEVDIFNAVYPDVAPKCADKRFVSKRITGDPKLPAASLWEISNTTVRDRQDSSRTEVFASIAYQGEVFARTKRECREIVKAMEDKLIAIGFTKVSGDYIDNPGKQDVERYVGRYEAEIDRNGMIYRKR